MAVDLDAPDDEESIFLAVGDEVDDTRPVNQGDVYRGVTLSGVPDDHHNLVMLTTHPCSLRAGPSLKARLQAAPIVRAKRINTAEWATEHKRSMPLPDLQAGKFFAATLTESGIVTPTQLASAKRIAALSEDGILHLQQRLVWALTHSVIGLDTLAEFSAPAFAEIELLEEWNEALCEENEPDRRGRLGEIAAEFETYIRSSGVQTDLAEERKRGDARRRTREELHRRLEATNDADERRVS